MATGVLERSQDQLALSTGTALLSAARRRHPDAWNQLVDQYSALVYHWCKQAALSPDDAADVLQTVMMKVAQHLSRFEKDGKKAAFRRWLATITRNCITDFLRARGRFPQGLGGTDALSLLRNLPEAGMTDVGSGGPLNGRPHVLDRLLATVESRVEQRTWQAFCLTMLDDLTSAEAGEALGMSAAAVRLAKARVLRQLRELSAAENSNA